MREAQDSASEPIAYTRVTKGGLPKLEPGTVDHIMKPPRPHRGVCTTQHLPAARSPQWHSARPRAAGTTTAKRRRAPPRADGHHRPPPRADGHRHAATPAAASGPPRRTPTSWASSQPAVPHRRADRGHQPAPPERRQPRAHDTKDKRHRMPPPESANHHTGHHPPTTKQEPPARQPKDTSRLHQVHIRQ